MCGKPFNVIDEVAQAEAAGGGAQSIKGLDRKRRCGQTTEKDFTVRQEETGWCCAQNPKEDGVLFLTHYFILFVFGRRCFKRERESASAKYCR